MTIPPPETDSNGRPILDRIRRHLPALQSLHDATRPGSTREAIRAAHQALQSHQSGQKAYEVLGYALTDLVDAVRALRDASTCLRRDPQAIAVAEAGLDEAILRAGVLRDDLDLPPRERS